MTEAEYRAELAKAEQFDIVRVRWRDSSRLGFGWSSIDEYVSSTDEARYGLEETTGYFLVANDAFVCIVQSIREWRPVESRRPTATDGMIIPHEAIRTFEIIAAGSKLDRSFGDEAASS